MTGARRQARQRTAVAVIFSLLGHAVVVFLIALDLDNGPGDESLAPVVNVSLTPLNLPIERLRRRPDKRPPPSRPTPRIAPRPLTDAPVFPLAAGPASPSPGPSSAPDAETPADLPTALRTGCVGKRGLEADKRVDCKLEIWTVLDSKGRKSLQVDTIPADKRAQYDAVARRQARQREAVSRLGNHKSMDCPNANLGTGCLDEMLIPLFGGDAKDR